MAVAQLVRRRMKSAKSIRQITKAMELVAVAKLRRAQATTVSSRTYAINTGEVLARLRYYTSAAAHPLFAQRPVSRELIVLFTSDRGLAGAYHANLFKALLQHAAPASAKLHVVTVGSKGAQFVSRLSSRLELVGAYTNWPSPPRLAEDVQPLVQMVSRLFLDKHADRVSLLYTDFVSLMRQAVTQRKVLPVDPDAFLPPGAQLPRRPTVTFEPSAAAVLDYIVPRFIEVQVYQAALEAAASEQTARMMSMKNASDNAGELIDDLTLTYNTARQAAITQELAEIAAGGAALT